MTTPTHILTGVALGTVLVVTNDNISPFSVFQVILLCVIFLNILDINVLWKKPLITHHEDITHYPIFSALVSLIALIINLVLFPESMILFQIVFFSLLIHLIQDTFGGSIGIHWLWPYSKKEYSFFKLHKYDPNQSLRERYDLYKFRGLFELVLVIVFVIIIIYGIYGWQIYN